MNFTTCKILILANAITVYWNVVYKCNKCKQQILASHSSWTSIYVALSLFNVLLQTNRSTLISLHSDFNLMAVNHVFEEKCVAFVHICNLSKSKVPNGVVLITSKSLVALLTLSNVSPGASPLSYVAILTLFTETSGNAYNRLCALAAKKCIKTLMA